METGRLVSEKLTFHFEGALADAHMLNFYESARFQYAAARLLVKLAQFRREGRFVQKITNMSNFSIQLESQSKGSFNINVEIPEQSKTEEKFIDITISDLVAYVSERVVEKIDEVSLRNVAVGWRIKTPARGSTRASTGMSLEELDDFVKQVISDKSLISDLPDDVKELIKRRVAETYREQRLSQNTLAVSRIDPARSQSLIKMSAPLLSEMATVLRKSAHTLEVRSASKDDQRSVLFLDRKMAGEIETAKVDKDITPILGNVTQFNKENGWGKLKIEEGMKTLSFSIPSDILPVIKKILIESMNKDSVYVQTYFVRDRSNQVARLIVVGVIPSPP